MQESRKQRTKIFLLSALVLCSCHTLCAAQGASVTIYLLDTSEKTINEGDMVIRQVCRDPRSPDTTAVPFTFTAIPGETSDLTFPSNSISMNLQCRTVQITTMDNEDREDTKTFLISLTSTTAVADENRDRFILNILDNDPGTGTESICPSPTTPVNGFPLLCPSTAGSSCTYQCTSGYRRLAGSFSRMCDPVTLRWNGIPLVCTQIKIRFTDTGAATIMENSMVTREVCHDSSDDSSVTVFFSLALPAPSSDLILPFNNIPANMQCTTVEIRSRDNSVREDSKTFQISLTSTFVAVDENQGWFILFVEDDDGDGTSAVECPPPTPAINGLTPFCFNHLPGGVCTYQCNSGFDIVAGLLSRICIPSLLRWTGNPPVCAQSGTPTSPVVIDNCPAMDITETVASYMIPPINVSVPVPTTVDGLVPSVTGVPASSSFPEGITLATYTFTNDAGRQAACTFNIIIDVDYCDAIPAACPAGATCIEGSSVPSQVDCVANVPPDTPNCPDNTLNIPTVQGSSTTPVEYGPFTCDDADQLSLITATCVPASGSQFNLGTSTVTCTCTDVLGEESQCMFDVIVADVDECATNGGHACDTTSSDCENTQGNYFCICKPGYIGSVYAPPSPATCQRDTAPPEVLCPSNMFRTVQLGTQSIAVMWNEPVAIDNSMSVSVFFQSHTSGSRFDVGKTTVTYVFVDPAGNKAECSFDVSVVEDCPVLYSNMQCHPQTCSCVDEPCDLDTGICRSMCTVLSCPADIESRSLSQVNPSSSVKINCTLRGSTAVLQRLQLMLSNNPDIHDGTDITLLSGNGFNTGHNALWTFMVDSVTKEKNLFCILYQGSTMIGRVSVTKFVHELASLKAAPVSGDTSNNSITINWGAWNPHTDDGDPPVVAYIPYFKRSLSEDWIRGAMKLQNETLEFRADNLEVDTHYDFSVAAVREGENGEGPRSPSVTVKTLCNVPDQVASVDVQLTESSQVNVSWQHFPGGTILCSTGVTSYNVYYRKEDSTDDSLQLAGTVNNADTKWFIVDEEFLDPGIVYVFFVTVSTDQESVYRESNSIEAPAEKPVYLISLVVIPVLVIAVVIVFLIVRNQRKNNSKDKKTTKADNGEDADYVNAAVTGDPEDYIPLEQHSKGTSPSKYEDLHQGGISTPSQYEVTIVPQPQRPAAAPRAVPRNKKGTSSNAYEDVGVSSEKRELPDVPPSHSSGDEDTTSYEVPDRLEEYTGVYVNVEKESKLPQAGPIKVKEFQKFMSRSRENVVRDIVHQFMALPSGGQYAWSDALKFQNKPKNFFKTILPCLRAVPYKEGFNLVSMSLQIPQSFKELSHLIHSLVLVLQQGVALQPHQEPKNHQGKISFIAAQGPQEGTVDDFWKMVWQENVETIVMVTDTSEGNKSLCSIYWPSKVHTSEVFDDITVLLMESTNYTTHTIRKVNLLKGDHKAEVHTVTQVQVHSWSYGGVPKETSSLMFIIKKVKTLQTNEGVSPLLVHCSNGIGATGTFIALYILIDIIKKNKDVNVFDVVKRMREDRIDMVQTRIQYLFIFEFLSAALQSTDSELSCDQIKKLGRAAVKVKSAKEFKVLQESVVRELHHEEYVGNSPGNQHKNRFTNLVPVDEFRPVLKSQGNTFGSNSYINAFHLADFGGREFIMTQAPLSSTVEDFWRLVYDYECTTIVMLNAVSGSDETVVQYWPSGGGGGAQYGLMTVKCTSTTEGDVCIQSQFQVTHKKLQKKSISVDHFAFCGWSGNQPEISKLRQFIRFTGNKGTGPMLVHCINGVGLSAVYVIVKTESERLEQDGCADVCQSLKKLRKKCPLAVQTQEEYTLCYQLLKDHLDNPEEYAVVY